jgi:hypothetical protein|tara:strand:- start:4079 stop:4180 length:102 start_codon:yes stop_codon:yes gene_type:complete
MGGAGGFSVLVNKSANQLPSFLGGDWPDDDLPF